MERDVRADAAPFGRTGVTLLLAGVGRRWASQGRVSEPPPSRRPSLASPLCSPLSPVGAPVFFPHTFSLGNTDFPRVALLPFVFRLNATI